MLKQTIFTILFALVSATAFAATPEVMEGQYIIIRDQSGFGKASTASGGTFAVVKQSISAELAIHAARAAQYGAPATQARVPYDADRAAKDCEEIYKDPSVISCEPNWIGYNQLTPSDTYFNELWGMHQANNLDIDAPQAWEITQGATNSQGQTTQAIVGVLDSGVNYNHPDLAPNLFYNPFEVFNGIDDDFNGFIDDIVGTNVNPSHPNFPQPLDCQGHGSHVAGTIGAQGNNIGVTGVARNISMIFATPHPDCGNGYDVMNMVTAIDYMHMMKGLGLPIRVINASVGGAPFNQAELDALTRIRNDGIVVVAAAGNNGSSNETTPFYPSGYNLDNIVAVANLTRAGVLSDDSNFGVTKVDIAAPGTDILSTFANTAENPVQPDPYGRLSGTSMATPHVTGIFALLFTHEPNLTYKQAIARVLTYSKPLDSLTGLVKTGSLASAHAALTKDVCPSDPNKKLAGVCGCGKPDTDTNSNGFLDCIETRVLNASPGAPALVRIENLIVVGMDSMPKGVSYQVNTTTTLPTGEVRKKKFTTDIPAGSFKKPPLGSLVKVSYLYKLGKNKKLKSKKSPVTKLKIKKKKN